MPSYDLTRCVVCDSVDGEVIATADDMRAESELLWQFHMQRLSPRTPPERLVDRVAFSQDRPWRLVRCRGCGLVYRNPIERPVTLRRAYAGAEPDHAALTALHFAQRPFYRTQLRRLQRFAPSHGSGLEVGSYVGAFLAAARDARWAFEGLDVNPHINAFTRSLGFVVHDGDLETYHRATPVRTVAIWNTFDQLPDPRAAVRSAARLLAPGGSLAIRVPNGACYAQWRARLDATAGLRAIALTILAQNNLLTFPYRYGFTPASLGRLVRDEGFRVRAVIADVLVPTADEWTRRWARWEERAVKLLTRPAMPWFELYAVRHS